MYCVAMRTLHAVVCNPTTPELSARPLIEVREAGRLARVFKVLANDSRLRLLHALARERELSVTDLASAVSMRPQAVSNQLQRLVDLDILGSRRGGSNVFYRVVDPCVTSLFDLGLCLTETPDTASDGLERATALAR
jgi:DNA-binding transcriptional ArsR family regulator